MHFRPSEFLPEFWNFSHMLPSGAKGTFQRNEQLKDPAQPFFFFYKTLFCFHVQVTSVWFAQKARLPNWSEVISSLVVCANMGTRSHTLLSAGGTGSMNWDPVDLVLVNVPKTQSC